MAVSRGAVLFLFLLIVATEIGTIDAKKKVAKKALLTTKVKKKLEKEKSKEKEESHCLSQSHQFKGFCFDSDKCAEVCMKESFPGGECKNNMAVRKCFCKKSC